MLCARGELLEKATITNHTMRKDFKGEEELEPILPFSVSSIGSITLPHPPVPTSLCLCLSLPLPSLSERCPQMAFGLLKPAENSSVCEPNHSMDLQAERARNGETDRVRDAEYVTKKKIMSNEKERGFCAAGGTLSPSWHLCFQPWLIVAALTASRVKMCIITS